MTVSTPTRRRCRPIPAAGASPLTPALVEDALAGDHDACRILVAGLTPTIRIRVNLALEHCAGLGRGRRIRQETLDLTQEVFLALFAADGRMLRRWDPARGASLSTFVGLIAEREARAILHSRRRSPWTEDPMQPDALVALPVEPSPDQRIACKELLREVLDRLRTRLSDRSLALFEALVIEEQPVDTVARTHGMSRDAIYTSRSRLRRTIGSIAAEVRSSHG